LVGFHFLTLLEYPAPTCDETFYGRTAIKYYDAVTTGTTWPALDAYFYLFHGRWYWMILGVVFSILGNTLIAARIVSLFGLVLLVFATFLIGNLYVNRKTGLWAALLVGTAWLTAYSGHLARPDILAVAIGTLSVVWVKYVLDNPHWWRFFSLGLLLILQLDFHVINIHLILPVLLMIVWQTRNDDAQKNWWTDLGITILGMLAATVIVLIVRYGTDITLLLSNINADDTMLLETIRGYRLVSVEKNWFNLGLAANFVQFWWSNFGWIAPFVSVPQALLFLLGLTGAYISDSVELKRLGVLVLVSSFTFMIINSDHAWLSYSLLWIPYYFVLGVAAVRRIYLRTNWNMLNKYCSNIVLSLYVVLNVTGDVYLVSGDNSGVSDSYQLEAQQILSQIPAESRVLAKQYWWYAMQNKIIYLDEHLVAPQGSLSWWVGVPDMESISALERDSLSQSKKQFVENLQPDFVVVDGVLGCNNVPDTQYDDFIMVLESNCKLQDKIDSKIYKQQSLYK
ncbi:MAG: hypothetical protein VX199_04840, partial [Chloroflexota bacterium]|nr:hypothetical protein [Chloroflexota bacterium]